VNRDGAPQTQAPEKYLIEVILFSEEMSCRTGISDAIVKSKLAITRAIASASVVVPEGIEAGHRQCVSNLPEQSMCSEFGNFVYDKRPDPLFQYVVRKMNAGIKTPLIALEGNDTGWHLL
jgi:hypothetical protein